MSKEVLERAKKRFAQAVEYENPGRIERLDDVCFVRKGEQWPDEIVNERTKRGANRPMLTINRLISFRNQIINDMRQNRTMIHVRPVDDAADKDTAEIFDGILRHIQDISRADIAYDTACEWQVDSGLGWFRINNDYVDGDTFEQEIFIERVPDPFKVYDDPESTDPTGSDAKWRFIVEEEAVPESEASRKKADWQESGVGDSWYDTTKNTKRRAEYYEIEEKEKTLVMLIDG